MYAQKKHKLLVSNISVTKCSTCPEDPNCHEYSGFNGARDGKGSCIPLLNFEPCWAAWHYQGAILVGFGLLFSQHCAATCWLGGSRSASKFGRAFFGNQTKVALQAHHIMHASPLQNSKNTSQNQIPIKQTSLDQYSPQRFLKGLVISSQRIIFLNLSPKHCSMYVLMFNLPSYPPKSKRKKGQVMAG